MLDALTLVLRTYTRAFVAQGVGIVGLAWCLAAGHAGFAVLLTVLVLVDQAIFLRGRRTTDDAVVPFGRWLDGWCLVISGLDVLICLATVFRTTGLRSGPGTPATSDPVDCLAYVLGAFSHAPTGLEPATPAGRLIGAAVALFGALAFLVALAAVMRSAAWAAPGADGRSR